MTGLHKRECPSAHSFLHEPDAHPVHSTAPQSTHIYVNVLAEDVVYEEGLLLSTLLGF